MGRVLEKRSGRGDQEAQGNEDGNVSSTSEDARPLKRLKKRVAEVPRIVPKTGLPTWWFSPHRHTLKEKACPDYKRALALKQKELEAQEKVERIERALAHLNEEAIHDKERGDVAKEKKEDFVEVDLDAMFDSMELPDKGMVLPKPRRVWKKLVKAKAKATPDTTPSPSSHRKPAMKMATQIVATKKHRLAKAKVKVKAKATRMTFTPCASGRQGTLCRPEDSF